MRELNFRKVHLDFHTSELISGIGEKFSKQKFQQALQAGCVNEITLFAKCHHGWMYYLSEKYPVHPNLSFDLLRQQQEAADEIGVATVLYLSAGFDEQLAMRHPEWLAHDENNQIVCTPSFTVPGFHLFCFGSPYLDYLLGQIEEVLTLYHPKDLFLDISAVQPCYCPSCLQKLRERGQSVNDMSAVKMLAEETFFRYTSSVQQLIDRVSPGTTVFHNGGHILRGRRDLLMTNTRFEVESLPTCPLWGYDHFPLSAAYMRSLGLEFSGMTGRFHSTWGEFGGYKHPNALRYETSMMLANGAACSIGDQLHPSGEMDEGTYALIGTAYREVQQKEAWCVDSEFLADIAVLSYESVDSKNSGRNGSAQIPDAGAVRILMEGNYLFEVIDTMADFTRYRVIILPDKVRLSEDLAKKLRDFVNHGGKILASGVSGLAKDKDCFALDFGAEYKMPSLKNPVYIEPEFPMSNLPKMKFVVYSDSFEIEAKEGLAKVYDPYFNRTADHFCSHQHAPAMQESKGYAITQGRDGAYFSFEVFTEYYKVGSICNKEMVTAVLDRLLEGQKTVVCDFPAQGMVTLAQRKKHSDYILHIVYASPVKRGNIQVIEDVLPLYQKNFKVRIQEKVKQICLVPSGEEVPFVCENGAVTFCVPKIECHQMVEIKY